MEGLQAALILLTLMSVPLTAVVGAFYVKAKKIGRAEDFKELDAKVTELMKDNAKLQGRIQTLETIVVEDMDFDTRRRFRREGFVLPEGAEEQVGQVEEVGVERRR